MVDPGRAVEITVEPKRAELAIAGDVGDAPRGPVASCLKMAQQRVLGQMLPEQLLGSGEVKHLCGLDLPGHLDWADQVVVRVRLGRHQAGYQADHTAWKLAAAGPVQLGEPVAELVQQPAVERHDPVSATGPG